MLGLLPSPPPPLPWFSLYLLFDNSRPSPLAIFVQTASSPLSKHFSSLSISLPHFFCAVLSPALPSSSYSSPLTYQRGQASLFCLKVTRSIWSSCRDTWGNLFAGGRCEETGVDSSGPLVTPDDRVKVATCCSYTWAATVCFKIQQTTCCNLI